MAGRAATGAWGAQSYSSPHPAETFGPSWPRYAMASKASASPLLAAFPSKATIVACNGAKPYCPRMTPGSPMPGATSAGRRVFHRGSTSRWRTSWIMSAMAVYQAITAAAIRK